MPTTAPSFRSSTNALADTSAVPPPFRLTIHAGLWPIALTIRSTFVISAVEVANCCSGSSSCRVDGVVCGVSTSASFGKRAPGAADPAAGNGSRMLYICAILLASCSSLAASNLCPWCLRKRHKQVIDFVLKQAARGGRRLSPPLCGSLRAACTSSLAVAWRPLGCLLAHCSRL